MKQKYYRKQPHWPVHTYCGKYECKSSQRSIWEITLYAAKIVTAEKLQYHILETWFVSGMSLQIHGLGMWSVWVSRGGCIGSWWGNRREGDHWGDLGVDGWIILGWIFRRWDVGIWTGLGWPRIATGGGRL